MAKLNYRGSLLIPSPRLNVPMTMCAQNILAPLLLFFVVVHVLAVRTRGDPEPALAVPKIRVLAGEINAFRVALASGLLSALGEIRGAGAEFGADGCVGGNPIGKSVFAVLDDATGKKVVSCERDKTWQLEIDSNGKTYALLAS